MKFAITTTLEDERSRTSHSEQIEEGDNQIGTESVGGLIGSTITNSGLARPLASLAYALAECEHSQIEEEITDAELALLDAAAGVREAWEKLDRR